MRNAHIQLAHALWQELLQLGDLAVDATCGNGKDLLFLCQRVLTETTGHVFALDLQQESIEESRLHLQKNLATHLLSRVTFFQQCHSSFPKEIAKESIQLVVYNLGYRPTGNKQITTQTATTLQSISTAMSLVRPGGRISLTCYPGHTEGAREQAAIVEFLQTLPSTWSFTWIVPPQMPLSRPALLVLSRQEILR